MLRSLKSLEKYKVSTTDGEVGRVANFLIDDDRWVVRYLVVNTGGGWGGREVLIAPYSLLDVDYSASRVRLSVTTRKVLSGPLIATDHPISRQHERDHCAYYGYPYYWGAGAEPLAMDVSMLEPPGRRAGESPTDVHLRSAMDLTGYAVDATDGSMGTVKDFLVDDASWEVRYLVLATSAWWPGKRVLVAPAWATRVSRAENRIYLGLTRDAVKASPRWSGSYSLDHTYEEALAQHYGGIPGWRARESTLEPEPDAPSRG